MPPPKPAGSTRSPKWSTSFACSPARSSISASTGGTCSATKVRTPRPSILKKWSPLATVQPVEVVAGRPDDVAGPGLPVMSLTAVPTPSSGSLVDPPHPQPAPAAVQARSNSSALISW